MMLLTAPLLAQSWTTSRSNIYYADGNIGIGTDTPAIPLEVSGAMGPGSTENLAASSGQLLLNSNSGIAMKAGSNTLATLVNGRSSGSTWLDTINTNGPISLHSGSTYIAATGYGLLSEDNSFTGAGDNASGYRMFGIAWSRSGGGNGQVAMGISTGATAYAASNLLLVAGGNESGAYAHASQSDPTLIICSRTVAGAATNQWIPFQHNTSNGVIQTGTGSLILNPASGFVGIGTTVPCADVVSSCKLAVKDALRANEVIVDTGWSDYVFDKDYRNAPLTEVKKYIQENHHPPGTFSVQEVAEKGVNPAEMQAKLLAKIEELTLHLVADEEKIAQPEKARGKEEK